MLCGGSDSVIIPIGTYSYLYITCLLLFPNFVPDKCYLRCTNAGLGGFVACRALSQKNDDPAKASRPWDSVIFHHFRTVFLFFFFNLMSYKSSLSVPFQSVLLKTVDFQNVGT